MTEARTYLDEILAAKRAELESGRPENPTLSKIEAVSYTHLTLPTILLV